MRSLCFVINLKNFIYYLLSNKNYKSFSQWKWHTGNSWGVENEDKQCTGCGKVQEEFYGCADIAIKDNLDVTTKKATLKKKKPTDSNELKNGKKQKCEKKLEFGSALNLNSIMNVFCEKMCNKKCKILLDALNENLKNNISNEPTEDLNTCLNTCPKLCNC